MSDQSTIEAIKKRNEERKVYLKERDHEPYQLEEASDDVDTLLSEIASRDAEIEQLAKRERRLVEILGSLGYTVTEVAGWFPGQTVTTTRRRL